MDESVVDEEPLAIVVGRLGRRLAHGLHAALGDLDLDPRQYQLLRTVADAAGCSQQAIGSRLHIPASRMVDLVDGLEQRGLVRRVANPDDRRAHALSLTPAGRRLMVRARTAVGRYDRSVSSSLSASERTTLVALLCRVGETCCDTVG